MGDEEGVIREGSLTPGGNRIGPKAWKLIVALSEYDDWMGAVLEVIDEARPTGTAGYEALRTAAQKFDRAFADLLNENTAEAWQRAQDHAARLRAALAAADKEPPPEGLDVERLGKALFALRLARRAIVLEDSGDIWIEADVLRAIDAALGTKP